MPVIMPILTPQMKGWVMTKANQGKGETLREEDTTTDEDRETEASEASKLDEALRTPKRKQTRGKDKALRSLFWPS